MYLASRMLYTTIVTVVGLGISLGAWAQLRRWTVPRIYHAPPELRRPILRDVFTPRGIFWLVIMVAAFISTMYMYHLLLVTPNEKMGGGLTVALVVITARRYFFYDVDERRHVTAAEARKEREEAPAAEEPKDR
mmetsp:Transcript_25763/g.89720  ORF Transcript_25763/g.89720 Transcript_25763/m.89720 type:complete len:134 (-) Transcript_25763:52-453(-)|eukprot:CAMPEP_0203807552 /NCGR_PEP_ID=MMETSP0115-20131106/1135_1 /ASSEMBLY_ACC=CAM_ASM_000227 /TAXON_ID=33651 /ORGANISM="Bicosoecid sp, Strain ms1" /LENGTH=133 /DNA_ID=CAMNT_0050716235 /DNA_START=229 /DNA_END=630 /DNA_ORIENTATION=+